MDGGDRDRGGADRVPLMSNFTKLCLFVRLFYFIFVHAFLFPFENLCILFLIKNYYIIIIIIILFLFFFYFYFFNNYSYIY